MGRNTPTDPDADGNAATGEAPTAEGAATVSEAATDGGTAPGDGGSNVAECEPNLLLVCVDCLRQDLLASDRTETPFLDSLRERGLECTDCYATATTTTPAVASLLTGTYSERNGVQSLQKGRLSPDVEPLASILGERGYHTEAMATGPLVPETGLDRGFDEYRCRDRDESMFGDWADRGIRRLESLPEPFFAFVHLWEIHEDVRVPSAYDRPEYGGTPYERALSALDAEIRSLVEAIPDDTVVAVVGDHGESITHRHNPLRLAAKSLRDALRYYGGVDTRGIVGRLNRRLDGYGPDIDDHFLENGHGENVFDFTTNVPFVLAGPGVDPATVDAQVRQVDVLPTLLEAIGVDVGTGRVSATDGGSASGREDAFGSTDASGLESGSDLETVTELEFDGKPIRPEAGVEDRVAYMRACGASLHRERNWARAVRDGDAKYVEYPDQDWEPEVYDLESDPRELEPVEDSALEARLAALLPETGVDPSQAEELEVEDRLRDLGYL